MGTTLQKTVTFIQYDIPPLKAGEYKLVAHQTVDQTTPNDFTAQRVFAVGGNRFQLPGDAIASYFPPSNANGEFDGVLPNVVLKVSTLPWQRTSVESELDAPWLAVLLLEKSETPPIKNGTAADVIPTGQTITVFGSKVTGTGKMPAGTFSYPGINPLDYGQAPDTPTSYIDLSVAMFSSIAPTATDLPYLAHIREIDTLDSVDDTQLSKQFSVVLGNRMPAINFNAVALLVSLENMGDYLPDDDGNASANFPQGISTVRLIVLASWNFYANNLDENFQNLAENLNKNMAGELGATTIKIDAPAPDATAVANAITDEATALTGADADTLVLNALAQGYVPLDHHLREAGDTVSWYRGPLLPYGGTGSFVSVPAFGPDAMLRYDPYTGMFDTSYAAAWQLGQLLALQSAAYSTALYQWKKTLGKNAAALAEQALLSAKLGDGTLFPSLVQTRGNRVFAPEIPDIVSQFIGQLRLLVGVPFAWLVPSEAMLPTESFRLFSVDPNWIEALVDGAFSIGRATQGELRIDKEQYDELTRRSARVARKARVNDRPHLARAKQANLGNSPQQVTGVLLRSQLVPGWPRLNINGYSDTQGNNEVPKLRMVMLSRDVMLCLFDGTVAMVAIHEAPEQLHCGVELKSGTASTTLRAVTGPNPGQQFLTDPKGGPASADVPLRADGQTIKVAAAANSVLTKLNTDFSQNIADFTSAEYALEFIKGVVKVEFVVGN
ncbi:conserved protein of unknown function [Bradyrhizobium sp. ORS 285]|uniref:hypothetical protein n=1 Tax=Bradyrhizobium sp. ORS 285 TaxID=115808 RepID=UPI000240AB3D|nr:hypothetical protein [Bradyrhizobium sp. ORS 285]CCD84732.1 conserved hypothetical protein [Bradyrhizobium sp. ORS 285]SMX61169.1 conserved protein of unknown function [Bradyrhizobium sp. ORS 285]